MVRQAPLGQTPGAAAVSSFCGCLSLPWRHTGGSGRACGSRRLVLAVLGGGVAAGAAAVAASAGEDFATVSGERSCLDQARVKIARAPDREALAVTTSRAFKEDLASFFCARGAAKLAALELGVYHGHTTVVLAAVFGQVVAVDVSPEYLRETARRCAGWRNVFYVAFDSYADPWWVLAANVVDVAIIDGDHKYEKVWSDAQNVLRFLFPAHWLVFDDFGVEADVRRVVAELLQVGALQRCWPVGRGKGGQGWLFPSVGLVNHSEGMLCSRGNASAGEAKPDFVSVTFLLYAVPAEQLVRAEGIVSFKPDGIVWTSQWGEGIWRLEDEEEEREAPAELEGPSKDGGAAAKQQTNKDYMTVAMLGLRHEVSGVWELLWNRGRSAFVLTPEGSTRTRWFGMRADRVTQPFRVASEYFD